MLIRKGVFVPPVLIWCRDNTLQQLALKNTFSSVKNDFSRLRGQTNEMEKIQGIINLSPYRSSLHWYDLLGILLLTEIKKTKKGRVDRSHKPFLSNCKYQNKIIAFDGTHTSYVVFHSRGFQDVPRALFADGRSF